MKDNKDIRLVAPFLADDFVELDEPIFDVSQYSEILSKNSDRLGLFKKYLICKLHDSEIIDISKLSDSLSITLSDFSTYLFAYAIITKFNLPIKTDSITFPLTVKLSGNLTVGYYQVDDNGLLYEIEPIDLDEYLYEQVTKINETQIEIVFHFWKSNIKTDKPGERIIIIVSAQNVSLTENQDQAWRELFGNKFDIFYRHFKQQFDSNEFVQSDDACIKLIEAVEKGE